jgi:hypothetical protein
LIQRLRLEQNVDWLLFASNALGFCFGVGKQEVKFGAIQTTALFFSRSNVSRDIMRLRTGGTVGLG